MEKHNENRLKHSESRNYTWKYYAWYTEYIFERRELRAKDRLELFLSEFSLQSKIKLNLNMDWTINALMYPEGYPYYCRQINTIFVLNKKIKVLLL